MITYLSNYIILVSNNAIYAARNYAYVYSLSGQIMNKLVTTHEKMSVEKQEQIQKFLANRANVIMSLYKTDSVTNELVYYLKDSKNILWEQFQEEYLNSMKYTSFYAYLQGN